MICVLNHVSDLTNPFGESPETCVLKSLSTSIIPKKTQMFMTGAIFLTLLLS